MFQKGIGFLINQFAPSLYEVRWGSGREKSSEKRGSYSEFLETFSGFFPGKYVKVTTFTYECDGIYDCTGMFICKIVNIIEPTITYKTSWFSGELKDLQFAPGQIIVELPNGESIPLYEKTVKIEADRFDEHCCVTQLFSTEFISECWKHDSRYSNVTKKIAFHVYRESEADSLIYDLREIEKRKKERAIELAENVPKPMQKLSDEEIVKLWQQTM